MSTTEQLSAIVERVREATKSLSGDEFRLREIAFEKLLEHELAGTPSTNGESNGALQSSSERGMTDLDTGYATPQARAQAIGRYFGIDAELAADLFVLEQEAPTLAIPSSKLAGSKAEAVRQIALLVCGSRTALGIETGTKQIREAVEAYGKFDSNFMTTLTKLDLIAVRGKPGSQNRLVRMRVIGAEAAQGLAQDLVSNGG